MFKIIRRIIAALLSVVGVLVLFVAILLVRCQTTPEVVYVSSSAVAPASGEIIDTTVAEMQSAGVMAFAPDNALLVADSKTGTIFAFEVAAGAAPSSPTSYDIYDVDVQIASLLGVSTDQIQINDLAVHPVDNTAYLSVMRGHGDSAIPVVLNVTTAGDISVVDLAGTPYTSVQIEGLPDEDLLFWDKVSGLNLSITDIDYYDGELYVAGLSNTEFSSELRTISYPFDGTVSYASTEIYHTVHDQNETRAPIRTQTIIDAGEADPILLAAYTCTPLVTLPLNEFDDGAHVMGKTIAELGYGNTPIDVIQFAQTGDDGSVQNMVMITHTDYSAMVLSVDQIMARNAEDGLTEVVGLGVIEGVDPFVTPLSGVLQVSDQDTEHLLMLKTNLDTNNLDLVSTVKGEYFRPDDLVIEGDVSES
ncbi:MAG: hypothetical protein AAGD96_05690 [Chloroflexota bacterium]